MILMALALGYFALDKFVLVPQGAPGDRDVATTAAASEPATASLAPAAEATSQAADSKSIAVLAFALAGFAIGSVVMANIVGIPEGADMTKYNYLRGNLPLLLVSLAGGIGLGEALDAALNHPERYHELLELAEPRILAFGGMFLLMVFLRYFLDEAKTLHWVGVLEQRLSRAGRVPSLEVALALLILFAVVIFYGVQTAMSARSQFGRLVAMGVILNFFFYIMINGMMVMGLIPVVGIPMPLLSYGGSAMLTVMLGFGILMSVQAHRKLVNN